AYTAKTAGTGLKATVKLEGWSTAAESAAYAITAGAAAEAQSAIKTDKDAYKTGDSMNVTVTLKDDSGNAVSGQADLLTDATVQVPNAAQAGNWADNKDGTYTATYTAKTAGTGLKATVKLDQWTRIIESDEYEILQSIAMPESIQVNDYTFEADAGFPTTGFTGAEFTLNLSQNKDVSDYTWTSDASWVSVTNGVVKFTGKGNGSKVTITGTPKKGDEEPISFSFTLEAWFINNGTTASGDWSSGDWSDAEAFCTQSGYNLPTVAQVTNARKKNGEHGTRAVGNLWSEWGDLTKYSSSGFETRIYLTSDRQDNGVPYTVTSTSGSIATEFVEPYMMCRKSL
ncbi:invasin domain 3-containing protein, partial [Escherichia coli]|nr:invasin [Escherichia coli]